MSVYCGVGQCPYNANSWCKKPGVMLTSMGVCHEVMKEDGSPRPFQEYLEYRIGEVNRDETESSVEIERDPAAI